MLPVRKVIDGLIYDNTASTFLSRDVWPTAHGDGERCLFRTANGRFFATLTGPRGTAYLHPLEPGEARDAYWNASEHYGDPLNFWPAEMQPVEA